MNEPTHAFVSTLRTKRSILSRRKTRRRLRCWLYLSALVIPATFNVYYKFPCESSLLDSGGAWRKRETRSAVYTPYHLSPGGGEKVLLNTIKQIQMITYGHVDVVVEHKNTCQRIHCLKDLARRLNVVDLKWDRIAIKLASTIELKYNIWFAMENRLFPTKQNFGRFGIYHCQFPFDGRDPKQAFQGVQRLSSYDVVYLNSRYTQFWFERHLTSIRMALLPSKLDGFAMHFPKIVNFPPHFDLQERNQEVQINFQSRLNIMLAGRFFPGIQNKGHLAAIEAFERLTLHLPSIELQLSLVGQTHIGTKGKQYVDKIKTRASKTPGVHVFADAEAALLREITQDAHIFWSVTGFEDESSDPANAEHFGLALLEAMSAGLIPVVLNKGGPREILEGFPAHLRVNSIEELAISTYHISQLSETDLNSLSNMAVKRAKDLALHFDRGFNQIFTLLGERLSPQNMDRWLQVHQRMRQLEAPTIVRKDLQRARCSPVDWDTKAMLYMDERIDLTLRASVSQLILKLGDSWRLHVWHSKWNADYVRTVLDDFPCVVYHSLDDMMNSSNGFDPREESAYNKIWKSDNFLKAVGNSVRYILTFQADVWFPPRSAFKAKWLKNDYIGAPWCHEGNWGYLNPEERPEASIKMLHNSRKIPYGLRVGNGGVSLRNLPKMRRILRDHNAEAEGNMILENEDIFYTFYLHKENDLIANVSDAAEFSLEILCQDIPEHRLLRRKFPSLDVGLTPFAMHKPFNILRQLEQDRSLRFAEFLDLFF